MNFETKIFDSSGAQLSQECPTHQHPANGNKQPHGKMSFGFGRLFRSGLAAQAVSALAKSFHAQAEKLPMICFVVFERPPLTRASTVRLVPPRFRGIKHLEMTAGRGPSRGALLQRGRDRGSKFRCYCAPAKQLESQPAP